MPYAIDYDDTTQLARYIGLALPGKTGADAAWRIGKPVWVAGANTPLRKVQWANTDRFDFSKTWNSRAGYTYLDNANIPLDDAFVDILPTGTSPGTVFDVGCDLSGRIEPWLDSTPMLLIPSGTPTGNQAKIVGTAVQLGTTIDLAINWLFVRVWIDGGFVA